MSVEASIKPPANAPENQQMDSGADKPRITERTEEKLEINPVNMTKLTSTADDEVQIPVKNGKKRIIHNEVERRRKGKINNHIFTLAKLLPNKECKKLSKNEVLLKAISYINQIKENHEKMLVGKMSEVQANEFTGMKKRIEDLEKQNSQFVKLLEIAGFPSGATSGITTQCDKMINKIDPATIIMTDNGEIDVVKSKNQINKLNAKRCGSVDIYSSIPKKKVNIKISDSNVEEIKSKTNFCENDIIVLSPDPTPPSSEKQDSNDSITDVTTSPRVTLPNAPATSSVTVSHPNVSCSKEPVIGNMNVVTAVTHSLQGGPIMSTSQNSPHLQLQPTTAMVSQIPMLNFGGTVNLMQGTQMQPVITINDQGIQVIQMMATPNGQMMVNSNNSSNSNVLLTSNSNSALVQPGNGVQIDCNPGSASAVGSLIAQNTQYMANPQVHLVTNSPPVIPATPNHGNVMLGASVPGAPHANTLLTLNSNSSSNQLPSALMLPNGQIIPVVREPQLPLMYQNQTQINGSLLMSANTNQNSTCTVFGTNPVGPITTRNCSVVSVTTAGGTNEIIMQSNSSKTEAVTTSTVSVSGSQNTVIVTQPNLINENANKETSTLSVSSPDEHAKQSKTHKTSNLANGIKKKSKSPVINRTQRNIKPKSACDSSASQSTSQASSPNVNPIPEAEKIDRLSVVPSKSAVNVTSSELIITSTSSTTTVASITTTSEKQNIHKSKAGEERVGSERSMQTTPTISTTNCPPNTMADILAQATESIFANSISDISNSPNPTYFNTCAINSGENVDFLNSINEAPKAAMHAPPSITYANVLSMSSSMTSVHDSIQISSNKSGIRRNSTAEILGDLVGEVYRTQRTLTSNSFEGENQSTLANLNSNANGRMLGADVLKSKRTNLEDEILSGKRNKMHNGSKLGSEDVTLTSTTASNSSVSFLSVSQLASSASVNSGNTPVNSSSGAVSFSNSVTSATLPFSIDTANSTDNSPLCSISPLLNSPIKSNDIFALSSSISGEEPHFNGNLGGNVNNHNSNNNNEILNVNSVANNHNGTITITPSTSTNITFPILSESTFVNHSVSASTATFTLPDLSGLSQNNNLELHNNYKTFSYPTNQASRPNLNAILNFQANDSLGFALSNSNNQECLMEKTMKSPNFDFRMRPHPVSRIPNSSHGSVNVTSSSLHFSGVGTPPAQVNRFQSYSSIPLSHPASSPSRMNSSTPNALNIDINQSGELSCGANKNKSSSPRQTENNVARQLNDLNSGCLQRSNSIHHLPRSSSSHLDANSLDQSIAVCSVTNHSQPQHQSHNYNNNNNANQRIHPINRQSPQMCAGSSPSPKSALENRSPLNNHCAAGNNSNNVSPKLSPIGHSNSRSSHSSVGHHSSATPFLHQRSPNLDLPLITSFSTESITMHNVSSNTRRESMFPPGQKQLTHPPLGMIQTSNSNQPPRAAISYSAESLIQTQDNSNNNRPNCARENHSSSSSNSVLRQTQSMHNTGSVSSSHTLPFMHGAHLNRTNENNQQMGFPYFPFQQSSEQTSHLLQLKPNQIQGNSGVGNKNSLQSTQPQPNFSFSLMPPGSHQINSETQPHHVQDQQNQQHQRHGNYLSMGNYGQVTPPMPGLESHKDLQVPRPPMTFSCMPPFPSSQSADQSIRHRHSASFLTTPPNRDHTIMSSPFPDSYTSSQGSLTSLSSNGNLVPLPIQGSDKSSGYKSRTQNVNKPDGKLSKSKQSQSGKKKNQQYQIEEVNLSNSIFETGRSTTPYFAIPNLSPPRNNEGPTYIPNNNPLFNKSRAGKNNSSNSGGNNHSKNGDSYNTLFHTRAQGGFNLNFQAPGFGMNHLNAEVNSGGSAVNQIGGSHINSAPPPPPLVTSSSSHVPNFNLSNIFPDINSSNETLNISPIKFHGNHILPPPPTPGSAQSTVDGHTLQHPQSGTLYHSNRGHHPPPPPPPPPGIHNGMTINSILSHSPHSFDGRTQMPVGINNAMTPWSWTSNIQ